MNSATARRVGVPSIYSSARTELAKLLIYGLFRKIRVLAQDGVQIILVNRYGEAGWGAVRETLRKNPSVWSLAHRGRAVEMIAPPPPTLGGLLKLAQEQARRAAQGDSDSCPPSITRLFNDHNWGKLGDP